MLSELTLKEKLAVQNVDKWCGVLGHRFAGFDAELNCLVESDSLKNTLAVRNVLFIREKFPKHKRYYKVVFGEGER